MFVLLKNSPNPAKVSLMEQGFHLRDVFNPTVVNQLTQNIARTWSTFDRNGFSNAVNSLLA